MPMVLTIVALVKCLGAQAAEVSETVIDVTGKPIKDAESHRQNARDESVWPLK
jgi:hypothetical protein